ncbi:24919_t:CDS:2, partial [Racocetra persica]
YFEEGLAALDNQKSSVQVVQNKGEPLPTRTFQVLQRICRQEIDIRNIVKLDSKKVSYSRGLGLCKKALNIAITNGSNKTLENILQQFIDKQISVQNKNIFEQKLNPENNEFTIEKNNSKNSSSSNQAEISELGSKKKNKHQCDT